MNLRPALGTTAMLFCMYAASIGAESDGVGPAPMSLKIDRRRVAHILHERRSGHNYVTMLIHGPFPWSYRAFPAPYRYDCGEPADCAVFLRRLDEHLVLGFEIQLSILNSHIESISFLSD